LASIFTGDKGTAFKGIMKGIVKVLELGRRSIPLIRADGDKVDKGDNGDQIMAGVPARIHAKHPRGWG
jgi:hypothetical protein